MRISKFQDTRHYGIRFKKAPSWTHRWFKRTRARLRKRLRTLSPSCTHSLESLETSLRHSQTVNVEFENQSPPVSLDVGPRPTWTGSRAWPPVVSTDGKTRFTDRDVHGLLIPCTETNPSFQRAFSRESARLRRLSILKHARSITHTHSREEPRPLSLTHISLETHTHSRIREYSTTNAARMSTARRTQHRAPLLASAQSAGCAPRSSIARG